MNKYRTQRGASMGHVMIFVAALGIVFIGAAALIFGKGATSFAEGQCEDLCRALGHKKIEVTAYGCVCEDPKTKERKVHTGAGYDHD